MSDLGVLGNLGEDGHFDVIAVEGFERQIRTLEEDNIELTSKLQGNMQHSVDGRVHTLTALIKPLGRTPIPSDNEI